MPNFKNAFRCKKCPETTGEKGCPMWWEMVLTHDVTGEKKLEKACGYTLLPQLLILNYKQTTHGLWAAYDMRNKVVKNIGKVITAVKDKLQLPDELQFEQIEEGTELPKIEGEQNDATPRS
jgi:hypothetical protein